MEDDEESKGDPIKPREKWLKEGLEALREGGTEALRIDPLARRLEVTKGSFYSHFSSKDEYLNAICEYWREQAMPMDVDRFFQVPGTLPEKLLALSRYVEGSERSRYDTAIRQLAKVNACAAEAIEAIGRARLEFSFEIFRRAGFPEAEARARGHLLSGWLLASVLIRGQLPPEVQDICRVLGDPAAERARTLLR